MRWRLSISCREVVIVCAACVCAWPIGRALVRRLGMVGEEASVGVGEGGVGETGEREISSRRSAMVLVSSCREVEGGSVGSRRGC